MLSAVLDLGGRALTLSVLTDWCLVRLTDSVELLMSELAINVVVASQRIGTAAARLSLESLLYIVGEVDSALLTLRSSRLAAPLVPVGGET